MQVFALESGCFGAQAAEAGKPQAETAAAMTGLLADESMALAEQATRRILAACGEGDMLRTQLAILRRLARFTPATLSGRAGLWHGRAGARTLSGVSWLISSRNRTAL